MGRLSVEKGNKLALYPPALSSSPRAKAPQRKGLFSLAVEIRERGTRLAGVEDKTNDICNSRPCPLPFACYSVWPFIFFDGSCLYLAGYLNGPEIQLSTTPIRL